MSTEKANIKTYYEKFANAVDSGLASIQDLEDSLNHCNDYAEAADVRKKVISIGESLGDLCSYLQKDDNFPDIEDFLLKWPPHDANLIINHNQTFIIYS